MTDDTNGGFKPTRRSVLRLGAMSALGIGIGIPAVSGSVAATIDCPKTPGYWANHPETWPDEDLTIAGKEGSNEYWRGILLDPPKGDKAKIMLKHYIATVLNLRTLQSGCTSAEIKYGYYEGYTIEQVKNMAGTWLRHTSSWQNGRKQTRWYVKVDREMVDGEKLKDTLDAFNNNPASLGLDCGCDDR
ncbi:Tat pathway signal protein [Haloferax sp. Atlit-12N]|uniref:Tat pathway signal protein n=1 Tax=Haloferax sp. Atlit-12N TaxID=2077203 RepID=UPI000E27FD20|nr:Tat pathway signal protein [Haloferax sp. Atlit-12N]RDZ65381.1 Tat pathway signal protein [Haloferax sp. Atlit-12N]